jgi:autotransporter family porin
LSQAHVGPPVHGAWTNGTGSGLANAAANWTDTIYHTHYIPGAHDYVLFGTGGGGSNSNCTVNLNLSVDRVVMDSTYTSTLTINSGQTLAMTNFFEQYGTLDLAGSAAVQANDYVNLHGTVATVAALGGGSATLSAGGSFYITSATITVTGTGSLGGSLTLSGGSFDDGGTINVGTSTSPGSLTVSGNFVENSSKTINVLGASTLTFVTGGNSSALADLKGALNLTANGSGNPTVSNAQELWVDGGTLTSTLGGGAVGNVIIGDVGVFNTGTVTVGGTSKLSLTLGSLTVGTTVPGLVSTGGTLTVSTGATLSFPPAAGVSSTFVVQGGVSSAVVNLNGATIAMATARVASLDLEAGVLNSNGALDTITGNLTNNGTVDFTGGLHTLTVTVGYTQNSSGTLDIRLDNGNASDKLSIGSTATLAGTLNLIAQNALSDGQTWTVLAAAGGISGDFSTKNFPQDGNPDWTETAGTVDN